MNDTYKRNIRGFTLVELLVVITIIGVLTGLTAAGVFYGRIMVLNAITKSQMVQISTALEQYKSEYGEYPPSLADEASVKRHVSSRWKRASSGYYDVLAAAFDLYKDNGDPDDSKIKQLDHSTLQAATLTFWLGGIYKDDEFIGFSADIADPFKSDGQRQPPMMDLELGKNIATYTFSYNGFDAVVPVFVVHKLPVAYFRSNAQGSYAFKESGDYAPQYCDFDGNGMIAVPYAKSIGDIGKITGQGPWSKDDWDDADIVWQAPKKFQLIHPGMDEEFGDRTADDYQTYLTSFADETGISRRDYDNVVNFTETANIQGALDQ